MNRIAFSGFFALSLTLVACGGGGGGGAKTTPPPSVVSLGISGKDIANIAKQFNGSGQISDSSTSALTLGLTLGVDCPSEAAFDDDLDGEDDRFEYTFVNCQDPETGLIFHGDGTILTTESSSLIIDSLDDSCLALIDSLSNPNYGEAGEFDLQVTDPESGDSYLMELDYQWGEFPNPGVGVLDFNLESFGFELENGTVVKVDMKACLEFDNLTEDLVPGGTLHIEVDNQATLAEIVEFEFVYVGANTVDFVVLDPNENVIASGTVNLDTETVTFD